MVQFSKLLQNKKTFLLATYSTLIAELFLTFFIVYYFRNHPKLSALTKQYFLFYFLSSLGIIILLTFFKLPIWIKLLLFTLLSIINGAFLHFASRLLPKELIDQALLGTIGIFIGLSILAIGLALLGIDLSWMGIYLLAALVGLLIATLILMLMKKENENTKKWHKALLIIGLILFSIYVMYFTNIMLNKNYTGDFITAALDLYLSFLNIFVRILGLESQ